MMDNGTLAVVTALSTAGAIVLLAVVLVVAVLWRGAGPGRKKAPARIDPPPPDKRRGATRAGRT